jgi:hypothetical protein
MQNPTITKNLRVIDSLLATVLIFTHGACGPDTIPKPVETTPEGQRLAEAVCTARAICGCADGRFTSVEACQADIAAVVDSAIANGVTIDDGCFESVLDSELLLECRGGPPPMEGYASCLMGSGSKNEGETCTLYNFVADRVSDCKDGLRCWGGTCASTFGPYPPLEAGDSCYRDKGCGTFDLYCAKSDLRCHPTRGLGEACDDYAGCQISSYCKDLGETGVGTCSERGESGSACGPKDWGACDSPNPSEEFYWCDPETSTCALGSAWICWLTHPAGT